MGSAASFAFSSWRVAVHRKLCVEVGDRKARLLEYARKSLEEAEALKREFLGDRVFLVDVANLTDWGATFLNWLCDNKEEEAFYDSSLGRNSDSREQALRRK